MTKSNNNTKTVKSGWVIFWLILFSPVGLFLLWKRTNWSKNTKIFLSVACVLLMIFSLTRNNQSVPANTSFSNQAVSISPVKEIVYEVYDEWDLGKVVIVSPEYFNENDMPLVGEKLRNDFGNESHAFIFVYDDKKAASMRKNDINQYSQSEQDYYFRHFIGQYTRNMDSDYNQFEIYYDTINGDNTETIKY